MAEIVRSFGYNLVSGLKFYKKLTFPGREQSVTVVGVVLGSSLG